MELPTRVLSRGYRQRNIQGITYCSWERKILKDILSGKLPDVLGDCNEQAVEANS